MPGRLTDAIGTLRRHLDQGVFTAAEPGPRLGRLEATIMVVAFLALATALQPLRVGAGNALHTLWAEDGTVFLQGAMTYGFFHDLTQTYSGYLVVVPRLIGEAGNLFGLRDAPVAIALTASAVVALCGVVVWIAAASMIHNPWLRGTLVALTVLAPTASLESISSGSYVLWYMLFASFWLLIWRPASDRGAILGAIFIFLTGLSTPEIWFFAPLALLRAITIRDRRDALLVGAWALSSAIQVPAYVGSGEKGVTPLWSHEIWTALLQRVLDGAALGERLGGIGWDGLGWGLLIFLIALTVAGLAIGLRRCEARARWLAGLGILIAVAMFVVSTYQRAVGALMAWPPNVHFGDGGRYTIVPALLLASIALVLVDQQLRRRRERGGLPYAPWLAGLVAGVLLLGMVVSFDVAESGVRGTPRWNEALDAAKITCVEEAAAFVPVPTSPPGFGVNVACAEIVPVSASDGAR
jgi:hypothetical protein